MYRSKNLAMISINLKILCCCLIPSHVLGTNIVEPDFGSLNIRVGKILEVSCHPEHPELALIRVDFATFAPTVILSNLYRYKIPLGHLRNKKTLFLLNIASLQLYNISHTPGEFSNGMLLLAHDGESEDILDVPPKAVQGDIVEVEGYSRYQQGTNLKLEDFEKIADDLYINSWNVATYKDKEFKIREEGCVTTKAVHDCPIIAV
ncbi:tyrosine--tRNA ligase, cytoplasmic-like [Planococcus citri]|uniref:tyrosine--tRNA ligase, cytoplasmic-like n=1 Tax=Planococcus citri TaxID=170843 RepID=UPI0031F8097E